MEFDLLFSLGDSGQGVGLPIGQFRKSCKHAGQRMTCLVFSW